MQYHLWQLRQKKKLSKGLLKLSIERLRRFLLLLLQLLVLRHVSEVVGV